MLREILEKKRKEDFKIHRKISHFSPPPILNSPNPPPPPVVPVPPLLPSSTWHCQWRLPPTPFRCAPASSSPREIDAPPPRAPFSLLVRFFGPEPSPARPRVSSCSGFLASAVLGLARAPVPAPLNLSDPCGPFLWAGSSRR